MNNKIYRIAIGAAACLAWGQAFGATSITYDITTDAGSAEVNGAYFVQATSTVATGTGVFSTFLRIQDATPSNSDLNHSKEDQAAAFNSDVAYGNPMKGEIDESQTSAITRTSLGTPTGFAGGSSVTGSFYQFGIDINEPNSSIQDYLSIDEFEVWIKSGDVSSATKYYDLTSSGAQKVYEMDIGEPAFGSGNVGNGQPPTTTDYNLLGRAVPGASGSGKADYLVLIPQSKFTAANPNWMSQNWNVFVWIMVGGVGTLNTLRYGEDSGFEEIGNVNGFTLNIPPPVPEAGTVAAVALLTAFTLGQWYVRRRGKPAV